MEGNLVINVQSSRCLMDAVKRPVPAKILLADNFS